MRGLKRRLEYPEFLKTVSSKYLVFQRQTLTAVILLTFMGIPFCPNVGRKFMLGNQGVYVFLSKIVFTNICKRLDQDSEFALWVKV